MSEKLPLRKAVNARFENERLDTAQLAALRAMQSGDASHDAGRRRWMAAGVAALVMAVVVGAFQVFDGRRVLSGERLLASIAEEVAANHLKLKPLEVEGSDLATVLDYFTMVDFQPVASPRLGREDETLLGGRYCSIQGVSAAQLRYESPDGSVSTWYEGTLPDESLASVPDVTAGATPARFNIRGMDVAVWREHGLVFAEARTAGQ